MSAPVWGGEGRSQARRREKKRPGPRAGKEPRSPQSSEAPRDGLRGGKAEGEGRGVRGLTALDNDAQDSQGGPRKRQAPSARSPGADVPIPSVLYVPVCLAQVVDAPLRARHNAVRCARPGGVKLGYAAVSGPGSPQLVTRNPDLEDVPREAARELLLVEVSDSVAVVA